MATPKKTKSKPKASSKKVLVKAKSSTKAAKAVKKSVKNIQKLIFEDYGIKESGLDVLIKEAYGTLGLETFFTCGEKEVRAWTMKKGSQAVEAAAEIHTDFATKFIKAEIYTYDDAINNREKINELKTMGLVKMVGRDYIMQEGDIAYFIKGQ